MRRSLFGALWRLSRAEGCLLAFVLVLLPHYLSGGDLWPSVGLALPILPIATCTFILNDINDIERDAVNHPSRPLPSGTISVKYAAAFYTALFILSQRHME